MTNLCVRIQSMQTSKAWKMVRLEQGLNEKSKSISVVSIMNLVEEYMESCMSYEKNLKNN